MDELCEDRNVGDTKSRECATETRDENRSPTSGSSSDACADEVHGGSVHNRKRVRNPRQKRKRKWRPYNELSWDEKMVQDDWESRRAYAKRERLSAEGHPIAPYNTTQFLMEDHTIQSVKTTAIAEVVVVAADYSPIAAGARLCSENNNEKCEMAATGNVKTQEKLTTAENTQRTGNNSSSRTDSKVEPSEFSVSSGTLVSSLPRHMQYIDDNNSPLRADITSSSFEKLLTAADDGRNQVDIQRYIMDDFSHTYADIHAEELQAKTKADLVDECLKLERKVDALERRVKYCARKHKHGQDKNRADVHLLEKINHLQVLNAQLQKENAILNGKEGSASAMPASI